MALSQFEHPKIDRDASDLYQEFERFRRIARHRFKQRKQGPTESFDNFLKDLRLILMDCEYTDPDDMLVDAIIAGVREKRVQ